MYVLLFMTELAQVYSRVVRVLETTVPLSEVVATKVAVLEPMALEVREYRLGVYLAMIVEESLVDTISVGEARAVYVIGDGLTHDAVGIEIEYGDEEDWGD
ncbi:unnamed protein product [Sphagnum balticum]